MGISIGRVQFSGREREYKEGVPPLPKFPREMTMTELKKFATTHGIDFKDDKVQTVRTFIGGKI